MNYGETLRKIRTLKGYSQDYVASKLGINQTSYSEWERKDKISDDKLEKLLAAFEITREQFNGFSHELIPSKPNQSEENPSIAFLLNIVAQQNEIIRRIVELQAEEKRKL